MYKIFKKMIIINVRLVTKKNIKLQIHIPLCQRGVQAGIVFSQYC